MPAGLDKHCLKRVHRHAVIGAMPGWVRIVVAPPMPFLTPINPHRVPAHRKAGRSLLRRTNPSIGMHY